MTALPLRTHTYTRTITTCYTLGTNKVFWQQHTKSSDFQRSYARPYREGNTSDETFKDDIGFMRKWKKGGKEDEEQRGPQRIIKAWRGLFKEEKKPLKLRKKRPLAGVAQWNEHQTENQGSPIGFSVRAHAWVVGQVPSRGRTRGHHTLMFPSFSLSLPPL